MMSDFLSGHTNLSALQIIGSCVSSLLGPNKAVKCLFDEESSEGVLVTSTNELLQGLDIEHPVGQLVREFCLSQYKCHGSGCTSLVTLAGLWAANVQSLLDQDVPIQDIVRVGDEFLQECEDFIDQSAVSIHAVSKFPMVNDERSSTASPQCSDLKEPSDLDSTKVRETEWRCLNHNSNNSCASPSHIPFHTSSHERSCLTDRKQTVSSDLPEGPSSFVTRHAGTVLSTSRDHASTGHSTSRDDESTFFLTSRDCESTVLSTRSAHPSAVVSTNSAHANTLLSTSSAKLDTSSALSKEDDNEDVSWFFEGDSQYSRKPLLETDPGDSGMLTGNLDAISLRGYDQIDPCRVEQIVTDEDDVEKFFNPISLGALSNSNDHKKTNSCSMQGDDISLDMINSRVIKDRRKPGERMSEASCTKPNVKLLRTGEKDEQRIGSNAQSVQKQNQTVPIEGNSLNEASLERSERLESLLKSAILQKPSNPKKGRPRIMSRHLLANELHVDMCPSKETPETPVRECESKVTSNDLCQRNTTDETVISSGHVLRQDVQMHSKNIHEDGPRILADKRMTTLEAILQAELSSEIKSLGESINHGAVLEMRLTIEAYQKQLKASRDSQRFHFKPDLVHIQTVTGPALSSSCCVDGLVVPIDENQLGTLHKVTGRRMMVLLVNGDLEESYRHRGFKDSLKSSSVISGIRTQGTSSGWTQSVLSSLKKLNINMLLVRGSVDSSLVDACCFHHILIIQHVPYRLLQLLGTVFKSSLVAYVQDALQDDVCNNIKVTYWSSGYDPHPTMRSRELKIKHHVQILCPANVMTIVISAPSEPLLTGVERRLHSCMAVLKGALHDGKVIPGGGTIEQRLVEKMMLKKAYSTDFHQYQQRLIYENLAQGLKSFTQLLDLNIGQHRLMDEVSNDEAGDYVSPSRNVHDCFSAKKGAWQRAWHLLKQVLLCDALIVTGVGQDDKTLERML